MTDERARGRAALYLRVSTGRQAEKDLSLPDQESQLREYAERHGLAVVRVFVEPGASARDDRRPVFQEMVAEAMGKAPPFDTILVLTTSRFFRDSMLAQFYKHKLATKGIRVLAAHQATSDDPSGKFMEHIFEAFDEYESAMNAFHTGRALRQNARRGYLNQRPKYGFTAQEVHDERGNRKSKPAVNDAEAVVVRRAFSLAARGLGAAQVASTLTSEGYTQRSGKHWSKQAVLNLLGDPAYKGEYTVNRIDIRSKRLRPETEWIVIPVPAVVEPKLWERVNDLVESRAPAVVNPSVAGSDRLLTGLLKCGKCGASMTIETGRGRGRRYYYYNCSRRLREGKQSCPGQRARADHIEDDILWHLAYELFSPERVRKILVELQESRTRQAEEDAARRRAMDAEARGIEARLKPYYEGIESGHMSTADAGPRITELRQRQEELLRQLDAIPDKDEAGELVVDDEAVERLTDNLEELFTGKDRTLARRYLLSLVDRVVLDGHVVHVHAKAQGVVRLSQPQAEQSPSTFTTEGLVLASAMCGSPEEPVHQLLLCRREKINSFSAQRTKRIDRLHARSGIDQLWRCLDAPPKASEGVRSC